MNFAGVSMDTSHSHTLIRLGPLLRLSEPGFYAAVVVTVTIRNPTARTCLLQAGRPPGGISPRRSKSSSPGARARSGERIVQRRLDLRGGHETPRMAQAGLRLLDGLKAGQRKETSAVIHLV